MPYVFALDELDLNFCKVFKRVILVIIELQDSRVGPLRPRVINGKISFSQNDYSCKFVANWFVGATNYCIDENIKKKIIRSNL